MTLFYSVECMYDSSLISFPLLYIESAVIYCMYYDLSIHIITDLLHLCDVFSILLTHGENEVDSFTMDLQCYISSCVRLIDNVLIRKGMLCIW